ncbi:allantoin permease [Nocardioides mangrovicus]|uniref:Allantoin permease n=1 Tax=Nocardioides mangrovicus TaxID=2478913 RepID=A0A3L8NZA6_9ACTN|nr:cytosine permease [Nocardioides mangrovicus]RLV47997.1 allantoin permease [Nocardioides mangrovicus]
MSTDQAPRTSALTVETTGIEVIAEAERKGTPRQLFWPWFGANVSVLGISWGAFALGIGVSFWQATIVGILGIAISFLLCGYIAVAGKRGSAPTMVLSRAAFGVEGNRAPALLSWILTVGWETALCILATLATSTVLDQLGWSSGDATKLLALVVVAALTIAGGFMGFDLIMRMQSLITVVTAVLTVVYVALVWDKIDFGAVIAVPGGSATKVLGCFVLLLTAFGLGWVTMAADYSRYLPRTASTGGIVFWTTFGGALAPAILLIVGLLLAGSSKTLADGIGADPIGALAKELPTWALVPFLVVVVLGLVAGAVLDIYSSGLALLTAGVRIPRPVAALVDGAVMVVGSVYVVFFAGNFLFQFEGFLITLGVAVAAWCGVMLADIATRRGPYDDAALFDPRGRYGSVNVGALVVVGVGTVVGWGLVTNTYAAWLNWQGYLLGPLGLGGKTGTWAGSGIGVVVALVIGFAGGLAVVRRQGSLDRA